MRKFGLAWLSAFGVGCTASAVSAQTRYVDPVFASATAQYDIDYEPADDPSTFPYLLDVYTPTGDTATNRPLIVLVHGGGFSSTWGWLQRRAESIVNLANELARRGYVTASIEYRTRDFSGVSSYFPCDYDQNDIDATHLVDGRDCDPSVFAAARDAQYDVQKAIAWLQSHAAQFGVDPTRVGVLGESAGAITALNVANRPNASGVFSNIKGAVGLAAAMIDTEQRAGAPPMLVLHGEVDPVIDHSEAREVLRRGQQLGNFIELRSYCSQSHGFATNVAIPAVVPFLYERVVGGAAAQRYGQWFGATNRSPKSFAGQVQMEPAAGLVGDFDGNGRDDVLFHGADAACDVAWLSEAATTVGSTFAPRTLPNGIDANERPTVGDFDGDGKTDIFVYGVGTAADEVWWGGASGFTVTTASIGSDYTTLVGDFDGDLKDDIVWLGSSPMVWYGNANRTFDARSLNAYWWVFRPFVGDFDGDNRDDLFWYGPGTTNDVIWWGAANRSFVGTSPPAVDGDYTPTIGDFDGNGSSDVFWLGASPKLWYGQGATRSFQEVASGAYYWAFNAFAGDFDGDARRDVFWQSVSAGDDLLWYGTSARSWVGLTAPRMDGPVVPLTGDFNGDNIDDWFWKAQ